MAVFVAPVAAAGVGGAYVVALSKTYSHTANLSAKQLFGVENAYPWPFWRSWFSSNIDSNSTLSGNAAALLLAGVAFGIQRRLLWRHLGDALRPSAAEQAKKIKTTGQFLKVVGPGILENSANALATCGLVGLAKPWLDGGNNLHKIEQRG